MAVNLQELTQRLDVCVRRCDDEAGRLFTARVGVEGAKVFVLQWGLFTRHSRQCWANVVGNCPAVEARRFMVRENLYDEEANITTSHYEKLVRLVLRLGLKREEIDAAAPLPATEVTLLGWEALTRNRHWLEGLAAKAVLERVGLQGSLRKTMAEQWIRELKLSEHDADFFLLHLSADQVHSEGAYELLARYAEAHDLSKVLQAACQSLTLMALFQDGIATAMARHQSAAT